MRRLAIVVVLACAVSGCAVVAVTGAVVGTAASVAGTVVSTTVDVGAAAVRTTAKVVEKTVDVMTGGSSEPPGK